MQEHTAMYGTGDSLKEGVKKINAVVDTFPDVKATDRSLIWNSDLIVMLDLQNLLCQVRVRARVLRHSGGFRRWAAAVACPSQSALLLRWSMCDFHRALALSLPSLRFVAYASWTVWLVCVCLYSRCDKMPKVTRCLLYGAAPLGCSCIIALDSMRCARM